MGIQPIQIVMIVSAVLGYLLLIASTLFMDDGKTRFDYCEELRIKKEKVRDENNVEVLAWDKEKCGSALPYYIGGICGFMAAILQIVSAAICFQTLWVRRWCWATIAVCLLSILAFILPLCTWNLTDEKEGTLTLRSRETERGQPLTAKEKHLLMKTEFYLAMTIMDFLFAILAFAYCYFVIVKSKATVDVAGEPSNVGVVGEPSRLSNVGVKQDPAPAIPSSPDPEPDTPNLKSHTHKHKHKHPKHTDQDIQI